MNKLSFQFLYFIAILLSSTFLNINILSANDTVPVTIVVKGKELSAVKLVQGNIHLYKASDMVERIVDDFVMFQTRYESVDRFFIGCEEYIEEITPANYKEIIKLYMPKATYLHQQLGKLGFRFENVPYMVQYYNRFMIKDGYTCWQQ